MGDTVLADRGFDIHDSVGSYCSSLKIPALTEGEKQLSGIEVEQTTRIANARIHVERVIGNIRQKYSILSATQQINFVNSSLDKIVCYMCSHQYVRFSGTLSLIIIIFGSYIII